MSLEMSLINSKVELRLKWTNHCVLSANGNDNTDANPNDIIFTIKDTKIYAPVVIVSTKDNRKQHLSEELERSIHWNEYKRRSENKNTKKRV